MGQGPLPAPFPSPYTPPGTPADVRRQIHYATDGVQPPSQVYLDQNDFMLLSLNTVDSPVTVIIAYRILRPNGEILHGEERFVSTNSTGATQNQTFPLTEGFLLSMQVRQANLGNFQARGQTRVRIWTFRGQATGFQKQQTNLLIQGGIDQISELAWPGSFIEPTCSGQGAIRSITGTTPGAGAEITETVGTTQRWELKSIRFQLTTSATVATRGVALLIDDGVNPFFAIEAPSTQAASLVQQYTFAPVGARADKVFGTNIVTPIPPGIKLVSQFATAYRFRTSTTALQAGDQYTAPQYEIEQWFD